LGVLFILAILTLVFCAGAYLGQLTFEPRVIIEHEVIERVVYKPVERIVETIVYKPVDKMAELFDVPKSTICIRLKRLGLI
ncbi:unnamed protein product, partial [marine sediment metagenome]